MRRGSNRGRGGNYGGPENPRGGGGARGGGNAGGPLITGHLRDLEMELQLLKRKREIFEQEQNMLERFAHNTSSYSSGNSNQYPSNSNHYPAHSNNYSNNSNKRQYDNKQPFNTYNQQGSYNQQGAYNQQGTYNQQGNEQFNFTNVSSSYSPGPRPSNFKPQQGVKRQAWPVWQNENPSPPKRFNAPQNVNPSPKRFNAPQSINPWQNPNARQAEFKAVNQNPPQPKNFSAQTRPLTAQKPGISQRIRNKYHPQPQRNNFMPNKVTKPNQAKPAVYRPSLQTKKLIDETNKLIAHTKKLVGQSPKPKGRNPPPKVQNSSPKVTNTPSKSQKPVPNTKYTKKTFEPDNILHPYRQPSGQVKGRLELALGMIMKSVKDLCPDAGTLDYFNIPFIQRVIKHTLRLRIKNVMMNKPVVNLKDIVDKYREKYPQETDLELMKIAQDAHEYNNNQRVLQLIDADTPEEFFKKNIGKVLHNKLCDMFEDLQKLYEKKDTNVEELAESFLPAPKENNKDETKDNENGEKGSSGEIVTSGEKDTTGVEDTDGEKVTDGDKNKDEGEDADGEKTTNDEKDKSDSNTKHVESSDEDIKRIVDLVQNRSEKSKKYVEFMEKLIDQKLPLAFQKFKEEFLSILCFDKEFVRMKALIVMETRSKLRESLQHVITIDDDDDEQTEAKPKAANPVKSTTPAASAATSKPAATASKPTASSTTPTKPVAASTTPAKPAATAAKPLAPSTTPAKPATPTQAAKPAPAVKPATTSTPAKPATPVKPVAPTTPAKPVTPVKPAATTTPAKPATATGKSATLAKADENNVPTTPKTPASKNIQYVKLIGHPALPARAVIYEFLSQFSPASIKKHKSINNLLVIGFTDKEGVEKILTANESVVGDATIIVKASEQLCTPVQNKTPQPGNKTPAQNKENEQNKTNDQENVRESEKNNKTPAPTDTSKDITEENKPTNENILDSSTDDIIPSDLDSQISDLLSSIRKADEEEKDEPKDVEKMDTTDIDDKVADLTKEEEVSDQIEETVEEIKKVDAKESTTEDSNTATIDLDTIMEDDDETTKAKEIEKDNAKESTTADSNTATIDLDTIMEDDDETKTGNIKAKAVKEVVKTAKESGRATPTRSSSRLVSVTPSTIKTRRASRLANNN